MNFKFDAKKATQVACLFIQKEADSINIMKLVKLIYLLDRLSIVRRGIPVVGGDYFSMKNGPVISEILDLINSGTLYFVKTDWKKYISDRENHMVTIVESPGTDQLSESEKKMINQIYLQHGEKNQYQLREWCHRNCPEWHGITKGRKEISVERILQVSGKSSEIKKVIREQNEIEYLDSILGKNVC